MPGRVIHRRKSKDLAAVMIRSMSLTGISKAKIKRNEGKEDEEDEFVDIDDTGEIAMLAKEVAIHMSGFGKSPNFAIAMRNGVPNPKVESLQSFIEESMVVRTLSDLAECSGSTGFPTLIDRVECGTENIASFSYTTAPGPVDTITSYLARLAVIGDEDEFVRAITSLFLQVLLAVEAAREEVVVPMSLLRPSMVGVGIFDCSPEQKEREFERPRGAASMFIPREDLEDHHAVLDIAGIASIRRPSSPKETGLIDRFFSPFHIGPLAPDDHGTDKYNQWAKIMFSDSEDRDLHAIRYFIHVSMPSRYDHQDKRWEVDDSSDDTEWDCLSEFLVATQNPGATIASLLEHNLFQRFKTPLSG